MYLNKSVLLHAIDELRNLDGGNLAQGLTQKISFVRHFLALDAFCKSSGKSSLNCGDGNGDDKKLFYSKVADVVLVYGTYHTPDFVKLANGGGNCSVNSNFIGGGPVLKSKDVDVELNYPQTATEDKVLLKVKNRIVKIAANGYANIANYFANEKIKVALFVWIARNCGDFVPREGLAIQVRNYAETLYSEELIHAIFPKDAAFEEFENGNMYSSEKARFSKSDFSNSSKSHEVNFSVSELPLQLITYGAPGTGKSHRVDALTNETNSIRVTFHPDTDYSMFVGSYKPTMTAQERYALDATGKTHKIDAKEKAISYSFVPQAFLKAYVEAWRRWCDAALPDEEKRCYLVIEEINRGNCAQIFGDMFQLLDRCESGWSCYAVAPDDDIQRFLSEDAKYGLGGLAWTNNVANDEGKTIATAEQIKTGARMVLPPNLCILATMNTSDQSLFPIDSAFKRRWDWEYVPITEGRAKDGEPLGWKIRPVEKTEDIAEGTPEYDWWDFVRGVNARIGVATRSEDKKIGYFFVKPEALDGKRVVTAKKILSKVIFYLWNDVFKDLGFAKIFSRNGKGVEFNEFYGEDGKMNVDLVREFVEAMVGKADATPAQQG